MAAPEAASREDGGPGTDARSRTASPLRLVVRNSAFGFAAQAVIKLLSFAFSVLVVRHLGAETYGQYAAVLAFGAVFVFIADLGIGTFTVRQVARWREAPDADALIARLFANVLALRVLLSLLTATLVIGAAWLTQRPLVMVVAIAMGTVGLVMYSVQGASDAVLAGYERLDLSAAARVLYQITFVVVGTVVLFLGLGYYGLILGNLLGIGLMTYTCWRGVTSLGVRPGSVVMTEWPGLLRASLPFAVIGLTLGLSYRFDSVLLNLYRSDAETGYYSAAYNLVFAAVTLSNVVNTALYPSLSRLAAGDREALPTVAERALRYLLILSLPIAAGGWALADQVVDFLYGGAYSPAVDALRIVIWVTPLMFASELLGYVVVIGDKEHKVARSIVVSSVVNVSLNLILVPRYGFLAAAAMTVLTETILVSQYVWLLRDQVRRFDWRRVLLRPVTATGLMVAAVLALKDLLPLAGSLTAGVVTYAALALVLRAVTPDEVGSLARLSRAMRGGPRIVAAPSPEGDGEAASSSASAISPLPAVRSAPSER